MKRLAPLLLATLLWSGAPPHAGEEKRRAASGGSGDAYPGLSVPLNATDLLSPETGFNIGGWRSWSGEGKIVSLVKDGQAVKKGEEVARFEFNGAEALRHVQTQLARVQADEAQARIQAEQKVEGLEVDRRNRKLEAELAAIDIRKERAISQRQVKLYRISHKLAELEAAAVEDRLSSAIRTRDAQLAFHALMVKRRKQDLDRYAFYEKRFKVFAPHDGVVRHAYNARERRTVQRGDAVRPGSKVVAVARDALLGVRFFVPEHRIHTLKIGAPVSVISPASGEELTAVIKRIDYFPQELGFLMEIPDLPNAREKAFAVVAEFDKQPEGLAAGTELKVKAVVP